MNSKVAKEALIEAINTLFGELPVRIIFARDHDVTLHVDTPCSLFETVDLQGKIKELTPGYEFVTCILGLHRKSKTGSDMLPILWGGKKVWVSQRHLHEVPRIEWSEERKAKPISFGDEKKVAKK